MEVSAGRETARSARRHPAATLGPAVSAVFGVLYVEASKKKDERDGRPGRAEACADGSLLFYDVSLAISNPPDEAIPG